MTTIDTLAEDCARIRSQIPDGILRPQSRIAIYGAGFLGEWAIRWLRGIDINPVACFDGNSARHGSEFHGVTVEPPSKIAILKPDLIFITARHAARIIQQALNEYSSNNCSLESYLVSVHFDRFREIHDGAFDDELSKATLRAVVSSMLTGNAANLYPVLEKDQYFCLPQFSGDDREVFIDAGAYVGDSLERFIWSTAGAFSRIHAFEPGDRQFTALQSRVLRLSREWALEPDAIKLNRTGLAERTGFVSATTSSGQMQSLSLSPVGDAGSTSIDTLDNYLHGERATFIKADVEGMELALLKGAAQTISRWKPKLAICVYHYPLDLPDTIAYIRALVPNYRFALRHHSPQQMETVLYCWMP